MIIVLLSSCSESNAFEAKRIVAKTLLSRECDAVVKAATRSMEKKHAFASEVLQQLAESRCDCITDSLAVQLAKDLSMKELEQMKNAAGDSLAPMLEREVEKSGAAVGNCLKDNYPL